MAITKLPAPTIDIAKAAAAELFTRGYDAETQGWFVLSNAGQSFVAQVIATNARRASYKSMADCAEVPNE